jgi:hypothetical protein
MPGDQTELTLRAWRYGQFTKLVTAASFCRQLGDVGGDVRWRKKPQKG